METLYFFAPNMKGVGIFSGSVINLARVYVLSTTTEPNYVKNYYSPSSRTAEFNSCFKTAKLSVS